MLSLLHTLKHFYRPRLDWEIGLATDSSIRPCPQLALRCLAKKTGQCSQQHEESTDYVGLDFSVLMQMYIHT